jgi:hypothetical protein
MAPDLDTVPSPGVWREAPAELTGGLIVVMARTLDSWFPLKFFERMVRFIWNRVQRSDISEFPLVVRNCGWIINVAGIDLYRQADGSYVNFDDPIRAGTGAAMYYLVRADGRGVIVGQGILTAQYSIVGATANVRLELSDSHPDHWMRTCGEAPPCGNLDGSCT